MESNEAGYAVKPLLPEPTPLHDYTNKVDTSICPHCRKDRTPDWFGGHKLCWKCRALGAE